MKNDYLAKASEKINAPIDEVWDSFINPDIIKKYMFGTTVSSDWKVGSKITWKGEYEGKQYEDKGKVLEIEPMKLLKYSHYSPLSGNEDSSENYHNVTITLDRDNDGVVVNLEQNNNSTEESAEHSEKNWKSMLHELKKLLEK